MVDPQRKPKGCFLVVFLLLSGGLLLQGLFSSDDAFVDSEQTRRDFVFLGAASIVSSILWYFFGTIDIDSNSN